LPRYQELRKHHAHRLVLKTIDFKRACAGDYVSEYLAVSHRWETPKDPDPDGRQLESLRKHLMSNRAIKWVFFDYCSMPQGSDKMASEQSMFKVMLPNINLLYIGATVLVLLDRSYMSRFWTQFEAWLSMQQAGPRGLNSAPREQLRCRMACLGNAPLELQSALMEEWSHCTAQVAFDKLSSADVTVTNKSDKDIQLPKILKLDKAVRDLFATGSGASEGTQISAPPPPEPPTLGEGPRAQLRTSDSRPRQYAVGEYAVRAAQQEAVNFYHSKYVEADAARFLAISRAATAESRATVQEKRADVLQEQVDLLTAQVQELASELQRERAQSQSRGIVGATSGEI
jgi:hypothetical protein